MSEFFDLEALVRALLMALGIGFLIEAVAYFVLRDRPNWPRWKPALIMGGIGMVLVLTAFIFYALPSLVEVPRLDSLSQAEAEQGLVKKRLIPVAKPQYSETEAGRVIPHSQEPVAGIKVRPGTVVRFSISQGFKSSKSTYKGEIASQVSVSLFRPKSSDRLHCTRYPDRIYRFSVVGASTGLSVDLRLLLWVRPVSPPSETPGWYLQRPPINGIGRIETDGSWEGIAQIGNAQWPPHEGDILDVAITVVDKESADQLMAEAGVVIRDQPIGIKSDTASGVIVTLR